MSRANRLHPDRPLKPDSNPQQCSSALLPYWFVAKALDDKHPYNKAHLRNYALRRNRPNHA